MQPPQVVRITHLRSPVCVHVCVRVQGGVGEGGRRTASLSCGCLGLAHGDR